MDCAKINSPGTAQQQTSFSIILFTLNNIVPSVSIKFLQALATGSEWGSWMLRVHEVCGEFPFPFDVDFSS